MKDTLVITLGGTIDAKPYDPEHTPDKITPLPESAVPTVLDEMGYAGQCDFIHLPPKDSVDITHDDIDALADTIDKDHQHKRVVVTMGTNTMPQTARTLIGLLEERSLEDKQIIVTGAMQPLANLHAYHENNPGSKDGMHNLRAIFAKPERFTPGVQLCINGMRFDPDRVQKDMSAEHPKDRRFILPSDAPENSGFSR